MTLLDGSTVNNRNKDRQMHIGKHQKEITLVVERSKGDYDIEGPSKGVKMYIQANKTLTVS